MSIKWSKLGSHVLAGLIELLFAFFMMCGVFLLITTSPIFGPIAALTYFFQDEYTDGEPNKFVKIYLGLLITAYAFILFSGGERV